MTNTRGPWTSEQETEEGGLRQYSEAEMLVSANTAWWLMAMLISKRVRSNKSNLQKSPDRLTKVVIKYIYNIYFSILFYPEKLIWSRKELNGSISKKRNQG